MNKLFKKRGQVTIFVIIAIVLVVAVGGYFLVKDTFSSSGLPVAFEPVYNSFLSCLEKESELGIKILESQGGYIEPPEFEAGSEYMPFSSRLHFAGASIPYWYYVSGNNIQKEQVPSKSSMEKQLAEFINQRISNCDFEKYYGEGYVISFSKAEADVSIKDGSVQVSLKMPLVIEKAEEKSIINRHKISVKSNLGSLYNDAKRIYDYLQSTLFLENFGVDILRNYAPVDGVEMTCAPKVWNAQEVFQKLQSAIQANTLALKVQDGAYKLKSSEEKYFVMDIGVKNEVYFLNSPNWSYGFEVIPIQRGAMIAKPVGNQPGMGAIGFCYVPYHFVYSMKYPVLVQIMSGINRKQGNEIFQFPFAVVVQGNKPREPLDVEASVDYSLPEICEQANTEINVNVMDNSLRALDAEVSFECFGRICDIGKVNSAEPFYGLFPQCVNGKILVKAEGYKPASKIVSTVNEDVVDIFLEKEYEKEVKVNLGDQESIFDAIVTFESEDDSQTIIYPEQKKVKLSQGQYEIQVSIYRNTSIKLAESVTTECIEIPKTGIGALFGMTKKKCFEVKIPSQIISNAIAGGGVQKYYILESELQNSNVIEINAKSLPLPKSLEDLQKNYDLYEARGLDINFV